MIIGGFRRLTRDRLRMVALSLRQPTTLVLDLSHTGIAGVLSTYKSVNMKGSTRTLEALIARLRMDHQLCKAVRADSAMAHGLMSSIPEVDECIPHPCGDRATCEDLPLKNGFLCHCIPGYAGDGANGGENCTGNPTAAM